MQATILAERNQDEVAASNSLVPMFQKMFVYLAKRGGPTQPIVPGLPPPSKESLIAWFDAHNARTATLRVENRYATGRMTTCTTH